MDAQLTGLPPDEMTDLEKNLFPDDVGTENDQELFVSERNFILSKWHKNTKEFLQLSNDFDADVYKYLNRYGYINFGVIKNKPTVKQEKKKQEPIYFGDASHKPILSHVHIADAKAVAIVISDPAAAKRIAKNARALNPNVYVIVRTRFFSEIALFHSLGADDVIADEVEASREVFSSVLSKYEVSKETIEELRSTVHSQTS